VAGRPYQASILFPSTTLFRSIGGYIYSQLGRVPDIGESIEDAEHHVSMRIEAVENRRLRQVHLVRTEAPPNPEDEGEEAAVNNEERKSTRLNSSHVKNSYAVL